MCGGGAGPHTQPHCFGLDSNGRSGVSRAGAAGHQSIAMGSGRASRCPPKLSPFGGKSGRDGEPPPRGAPWETANAWRFARSSPATLSKKVVYDKQQEQQCANQTQISAVNTTTILSCLKFPAPQCRNLPTATRHPHGPGKTKICFGNPKALRADETPTLFRYNLNSENVYREITFQGPCFHNFRREMLFVCTC